MSEKKISSASRLSHMFDDDLPDDINQLVGNYIPDDSLRQKIASVTPKEKKVKEDDKKENAKVKDKSSNKVDKKNSLKSVDNNLVVDNSSVVAENKPVNSQLTKTTNSKSHKDKERKNSADSSKRNNNKSSRLNLDYTRPYRNKENSRCKEIPPIRVSQKEYEYIQSNAAMCGMKITEYSRRLILGYRPKQKQPLTKDNKLMLMDYKEILTDLRKMHNFFNKDRHDPEVWNQLEAAIKLLTSEIGKLES